jgi:hypothetical protein
MIGEAVPVLVGIAPALVASVAVGGIIGVSLMAILDGIRRRR